MKTNKDGGAAFPCHTNPLPGKLANAPQGMTLRQYYKAAALLSNRDPNLHVENIAVTTGVLADALLSEDEEHAKK